MDIFELKAQGYSIRKIAAMIGHPRNTIRKYLHAEEIPKRKPVAPRPSKLDPYKAMINHLVLEKGSITAKSCWASCASRAVPAARASMQGLGAELAAAEGPRPSCARRPRPVTWPRWTSGFASTGTLRAPSSTSTAS